MFLFYGYIFFKLKKREGSTLLLKSLLLDIQVISTHYYQNPPWPFKGVFFLVFFSVQRLTSFRYISKFLGLFWFVITGVTTRSPGRLVIPSWPSSYKWLYWMEMNGKCTYFSFELKPGRKVNAYLHIIRGGQLKVDFLNSLFLSLELIEKKNTHFNMVLIPSLNLFSVFHYSIFVWVFHRRKPSKI